MLRDWEGLLHRGVVGEITVYMKTDDPVYSGRLWMLLDGFWKAGLQIFVVALSLSTLETVARKNWKAMENEYRGP